LESFQEFYNFERIHSGTAYTSPYLNFLQKEKEYKTEDMTPEQLIEAVKWASTGLIKDGLCEVIQEFFTQEQLLYQLIS
jgi:hypothetical protein